ncbi:alpha/beta fold hydrolase [Aeromicrobium fastidiosum]|uniref:Alpha/beta hydrolase n=1 Tax=Aeromicrobium fastidiosum TaxID=52699 RepID=A0A641AHC6_9ACTN|nr:alpha/beta hydrolase [Aeromicrobium fastidiosum]KAA1373075.1 alpha/beta hydrolase [Aeromicrobium fastidiosum]MBP2391059.1 pimeloyl-ACP methyl ester carboxylesterase [Aeromicrobium fastidiosum]
MTSTATHAENVLARPGALTELDIGAQEAVRNGVEGWLNDDLAFCHRPWGCDLSQVTADTLMVFGEADVLVPHAHGDAYLRAIGHGQLVKIPDAGHWMDDVEPAILEWLVSDTAAPAELY